MATAIYWVTPSDNFEEILVGGGGEALSCESGFSTLNSKLLIKISKILIFQLDKSERYIFLLQSPKIKPARPVVTKHYV